MAEVKVTLTECLECNQIFVEDFDPCNFEKHPKQNGAYSVVSRKARHHGKPLSLLGYATDVRLDSSKLRVSFGK
jgi:hypothetical protein